MSGVPSSRRPVVAVLIDDARPPGMAEVARTAEVRYADAAGLPAIIRDADVLLVWDFLSDAITAAWPHATRLRWMHTASAGVDRILTPEVTGSGVTVTNSGGIFDRSMAEYILGLVLAFAKDLPGTLASQRAHRWRHRETETLDGRTAVVVGVGPIGRATARALQACGLRVAGVGRSRRTGDPVFGEVLADTDLLGVLPQADYVIVTAPLTGRTRGMFDRRAFSAMRPTARFINVGRGPIVVEEALLAALRSGQIAGAALDVFGHEPIPETSPWWDLPNVIVSPHMSGDFVGWRDALAALFTANYRRWIAGQPLDHVVDKRAGYPAPEAGGLPPPGAAGSRPPVADGL
jgi:phosphoglycerate dehydrogenase-like enzyme